MRTALFLFLFACAKSTSPTALTPESLPTSSPVYFASGGTGLASSGDDATLQEVIATLTKNPTLTVRLYGYTDAAGSSDKNRALSESRAGYIRDRMVSAGVDPSRIVVQGMGETNSGDATKDRRVEFAFAYAATPTTTTTTTATATASDTSKSSKSDSSASKSDSSSSKSTASKATERKDMEITEIAEIDSVFSKAQAILNRLRAAQDRIATARTSVLTIMGLAADASFASALTELKASAQDSISVTFQGTTPKLVVTNSPSPTVSNAATAINNLVNAIVTSVAEMPKIKDDAMALIAEVQTLPPRVPGIAQQAGLSPTKIPPLLGKVKSNVTLTLSIPKEVQGVIDEGTETFNAIKSGFQK